MNDSVFLDTNILLYSVGRSGDPREAAARAFLTDLVQSANVWISTQVVMEFTANLISKSKVEPAQASVAVRKFDAFGILRLDEEDVQAALGWMQRAKLSFWNACIVAAAERANCKVLYTEDLQHGARLGSLRVTNPFVT